ncbi:MAG: hypothetical protein IJ801_09875 [Lachnospiraceae bacterium]|nr:hypothetical protein [Lachnospiraceae bacterium]
MLHEVIAMEDTAILMSTHIEEEIATHMDYVARMEHGTLISFEEAGEALSDRTGRDCVMYMVSEICSHLFFHLQKLTVPSPEFFRKCPDKKRYDDVLSSSPHGNVLHFQKAPSAGATFTRQSFPKKAIP